MNYYDKKVIPFVKKIKSQINRSIYKNKFEIALKLISFLSDFLYQINQYFIDEELEDLTILLSEKLFEKKKIDSVDGNTVLFYDGFGLDNRGLANIYLKGLCKNGYRIVYVVEKSKEKSLPRILSLLNSYNAEIVFIECNKHVERSKAIREIIDGTCPKSIFIYTKPNDAAAVAALISIEGQIKKYLINLTDHAFWLGGKVFDYYIEFRDYGASISHYKRNIDKDKIIKLPFYPDINKNAEFEGFPFDFDESRQKFFFSGGAIYKTFGDNDRYYKLVEMILDKYNNLFFWYAGSGDLVKLNMLKNKYKDRVFITEERKDIYQILQKCFFYLSTYPICGGLMFQYSASAGRLPITLYHDDISSDFLIDQSDLGIEFKNEEQLLKELDKIFSDEEYHAKKQKLITNSIITEEVFNNELKNLISENKTGFSVSYKKYDFSRLTDVYLQKINYRFVSNVVANKNFTIGLKYYPRYYIIGCFIKIKNKIIRRTK